MTQFLWFNEDIKINGKFIYLEQFLVKRLHFGVNLIEYHENIKPLVEFKKIFISWNHKDFTVCN